MDPRPTSNGPAVFGTVGIAGEILMSKQSLQLDEFGSNHQDERMASGRFI